MLEDIVSKVNEPKIELNTIAETVTPSHLVKLAGFKLPITLTAAASIGKFM